VKSVCIFLLGALLTVAAAELAIEPWKQPTQAIVVAYSAWSLTAAVTGIATGGLMFRFGIWFGLSESNFFERFVLALVAGFAGLGFGFITQRYIVGLVWTAVGFYDADPRSDLMMLAMGCVGTAAVAAVFGTGFWRWRFRGKHSDVV
jgi:hypothetical protein